MHTSNASQSKAPQARSSASGVSSLGGDVQGGAEDDDADSSDTFVPASRRGRGGAEDDADSSDIFEKIEADAEHPPYSSDMFEYSEADDDLPPEAAEAAAAAAAVDCAALAPPPPLNGLLASPAP